MRALKCLLFVTGMFCFTSIYAQVDLRLDSVIIGINSTIHQGAIDTTYISIYNDSTTTFTGVINIGATINGVPVDTGSSAAVYYPTDTAETITHGNFITRALLINTASFIVGTSGVVIWPVAVSTTPHLTVTIADTLGFALNVLYPVGIDELSERNLKVYMSGQQLVIQNTGIFMLNNVKLYDVTGKLLLQKEISVSGNIDMNAFANGVYFAEINFADNTRAIVKVVNTK